MSRSRTLDPVRYDEAAYRAKLAEARERAALAGPSVAEELAEELASLPESEASRALAELSTEQWARLLWSWHFWAREKQRAPPGDWLIWLILTGRGFGKTRSAAEWIRERVYAGTARVIALVGPTHGDISKYMLGGHLDAGGPLASKRQNASGLLDVFPAHHRPELDSKKGLVHFHTGAVAFISTAEEPEMRGGNFDTVWGDEVCKWRYLEEIWANLEMTCRVPPAPKIMLTTTPKNLPRLKAIIADPDTVVTCGHTRENASHLASKVLAKWERSYGGTRTGEQELAGGILEDNEGALWKSVAIERARHLEAIPPLAKIAIGVDPAVSTNARSDDTGIVVCGLGARDGHVYVLADRTGVYSPEQWGDIVIALWERWSPLAQTVVVCERNRQGDGAAASVRAAMYRRSVKRGGNDASATAASAAISIVQVLAMGAKDQRAEPVASLAARGFVHHCGLAEDFKVLESEMTGWDPKVHPDSPNAIDAHVHSVHHLIPELGAPPEMALDAAATFAGLAEAQAAIPAPAFAPVLSAGRARAPTDSDIEQYDRV